MTPVFPARCVCDAAEGVLAEGRTGLSADWPGSALIKLGSGGRAEDGVEAASVEHPVKPRFNFPN
jgi:hypothetical protein